MNLKFLAAGSVAAIALAGTPWGAGAAGATPATPTTRIMLAGDSITQGRDGDYTWRYRFDMELRRQQVTDVDLVGPQRWPRSYGSTLPHYLATGWDTDHDATSGTTLHYQVDYIGGEVAAEQPDILVSYLGTNDFLEVAHSHPGLTQAELLPFYEDRVTEVLDDWKTYLDNVRAANPTTKIVLGEVVSPNIPASIRDEYNQKLASMAASQWFALGSPIVVAQLAGSVWASSRYLYDRVHPTPTAETFLAQRFADALVDITGSAADPFGIFHEAPAIQKSYVAWNPPLATKTDRVGRRIRLNWAFAAVYDSTTKMRVKLVNIRSGRTWTTDFRTTTTWTSPLLWPGTYRVRLQAQRVGMTSTYGQSYLVKVPKTR